MPLGVTLIGLYFALIVVPGKQALFFLLVAFILTFLFIRFSVRMIRAGVSWWPGNINSGDVHVHHVVFGTVLMFVAGVLAFAPAGWESPWWEILGALFGVGCRARARRVRADPAPRRRVLVGAGAQVGRGRRAGRGRHRAAGARYAAVRRRHASTRGPAGAGADRSRSSSSGLLVGVALLKGRIWLGVLGLLVPLFALIGALRLAEPAFAVGPLALPGGLAEDRPGEARARRHDARWERLKHACSTR